MESSLNSKQELHNLLHHLIKLENDYINAIKKAKNRDTIRGCTIISDYKMVNKSSKEGDDVIIYIESKLGNYIHQIQCYINN